MGTKVTHPQTLDFIAAAISTVAIAITPTSIEPTTRNDNNCSAVSNLESGRCDFRALSIPPGYLHSVDPATNRVLCKVDRRNFLSSLGVKLVDEYFKEEISCQLAK